MYTYIYIYIVGIISPCPLLPIRESGSSLAFVWEVVAWWGWVPAASSVCAGVLELGGPFLEVSIIRMYSFLGCVRGTPVYASSHVKVNYVCRPLLQQHLALRCRVPLNLLVVSRK